MVTVTIDDKEIEIGADAMLIEAADKAGIPIPRFCYHKKLSVAANCRMCLVEVEKSPKPLPACATPVMEGMKAYTQSEKTKAAQHAVMEFLLINHPLDCPICDQGGQCELQDFSLEYGASQSQFDEQKRVVGDKPLGSLVATEMTRCIHCTRCVRFSQEIAGVYDLGATGRGEATEIGTYVEKTLSSPLSGNIVDVCPVGALTSKPFRYTARAWELSQHAGIAAHDCLGSNVYYHAHQQQVMRVVPREQEAINEVWLSDRDRFSYLSLTSDERLTSPMVKRDGAWQQVSWQEALTEASTKLKAVIEQHGAQQIAALASPNSTLEELYLLQKLWRALGSSHIDHRWQQLDCSDDEQAPLFPQLGMSIAELAQIDQVFLIGSNLQHEQPLLAARLRCAKDTTITSLSPMALSEDLPVAEQVVVDPQEMVTMLAGIVNVLVDADQQIKGVAPTEQQRRLAESLRQHPKTHILLGAWALNHPQAATIKCLAQAIAHAIHGSYGVLTVGANSAGAWLAGAVPHREAGGRLVAEPGLNASSMLQANLRAYLVYNLETELDCHQGELADRALRDADCVIACTPFVSDHMRDVADILLPIAPHAEMAGTLVNVEGLWQRSRAAVNPQGESRPGWKVLRVLANLLDCPGFEYESNLEIHDELLAQSQDTPIKAGRWELPATVETNASACSVLTEWPIYRGDNMLRRSQALQDIGHGRSLGIYMHPDLAASKQLKQGDSVNLAGVALTLYFESRLSPGTVLIPKGFQDTFSAVMGDVWQGELR